MTRLSGPGSGHGAAAVGPASRLEGAGVRTGRISLRSSRCAVRFVPYRGLPRHRHSDSSRRLWHRGLRTGDPELARARLAPGDGRTVVYRQRQRGTGRRPPNNRNHRVHRGGVNRCAQIHRCRIGSSTRENNVRARAQRCPPRYILPFSFVSARSCLPQPSLRFAVGASWPNVGSVLSPRRSRHTAILALGQASSASYFHSHCGGIPTLFPYSVR